MIGDIVGELLGAALAPGGKFGEWLAALLCLAAGIFAIGFGAWFAFAGIEAASLAVRMISASFFLLIALVCFWLSGRFLRTRRASDQKR
ncbi:MAG TPA: hypothetical protein VFV64_07845 [Permianibacter sp.]|nr:hypothetical protein [Permianibacter sp.]